MKLSILIPVLQPQHEANFEKLYAELLHQIGEDDIEILTFRDQGQERIGTKRNALLQKSKGEYIAFIDADDWIAPDYIETLLTGIASGADCCSIKGIITYHGINPEIFEHSIKYKIWQTNTMGEVKHERYPNHLNCIKADIAKRFSFPVTNFGEDHAYSKMLQASGLLKTEYYIEQVLYNYQFKPKKQPQWTR